MTRKLVLTDETDFTLTITDIRRTGHCPQGIRRWFEEHGYDFRDFLKNGRSAKELLETGDGLAEQVVTRVWEHRNG